MMSTIRSANTKPEILTRTALHRLGYRYRLDSKVRIQGKQIKPDIVLRKNNVIVFVHSCFFHQHPDCRLAYSGRSYSEFWKQKFEKNRTRDDKQKNALLDMGWRVAVVWECGTRNKDQFKKIVLQLDRFIKGEKEPYFESSFKVQI